MNKELFHKYQFCEGSFIESLKHFSVVKLQVHDKQSWQNTLSVMLHESIDIEIT